MSTSGGYIPSAADRAWVESIAVPVPPALAAIEAAAEPADVPILDRESGRPVPGRRKRATVRGRRFASSRTTERTV
jgi:hypothetical protein